MQGFERADRQSPNAVALAGHLVPADSVFAFPAAHRGRGVPDADYADLFCSVSTAATCVADGSSGLEPSGAALHDYSDRETAEAVRSTCGWKAAIGASLDDPEFDPSMLVYWHKRPARSERPHRVK